MWIPAFPSDKQLTNFACPVEQVLFNFLFRQLTICLSPCLLMHVACENSYPLFPVLECGVKKDGCFCRLVHCIGKMKKWEWKLKYLSSRKILVSQTTRQNFFEYYVFQLIYSTVAWSDDIMLTIIVFVWFVECTCFTAGTVNGSNVCEPNEEGLCTCKKNVEGLRCMSCKDTYYDLREDNIHGCTGDLLNYYKIINTIFTFIYQ